MKELRSKVAVAMSIGVVAALAVGLIAVYALPPIQPAPRLNLADCGFSTTCAATNPAGFDLTLSMNGTSIGPNGSLTLDIEITNPSGHPINMSSSRDWYLPSLSQEFCNDPATPFAFGVLKGYFTPENVSSGANIISSEYNPVNFTARCESINNHALTAAPYIFHFYPHGSQMQFHTGDICASNSTIPFRYPSGPYPYCEFPLMSDKPAQYTIAVGDYWGDLVLLNFSVHS